MANHELNVNFGGHAPILGPINRPIYPLAPLWQSPCPISPGMGQGNDRGTQYRSALYYFDEEQKQLYESSCAAYEKALQAAGKGRGKITTEIRAVQDFPEVGCDGRWDEVL